MPASTSTETRCASPHRPPPPPRRIAGVLLAAVLAAVPALAESNAGVVSQRALELELALAKTPDLYLLLAPRREVLEIKSRGMTLDTVPLAAASILTYRPFLRPGASSALELPQVLTVAQGPPGIGRKLISPATLRPYSPETGESEAATTSPSTPASAAKKKKEQEQGQPRPATYRMRLDNGWTLAVGDREERSALWSRFTTAVADGWQRLFGAARERPSELALTVAPEDARRLRHLFRPGLAILVTAATGSSDVLARKAAKSRPPAPPPGATPGPAERPSGAPPIPRVLAPLPRRPPAEVFPPPAGAPPNPPAQTPPPPPTAPPAASSPSVESTAGTPEPATPPPMAEPEASPHLLKGSSPGAPLFAGVRTQPTRDQPRSSAWVAPSPSSLEGGKGTEGLRG